MIIPKLTIRQQIKRWWYGHQFGCQVLILHNVAHIIIWYPGGGSRFFCSPSWIERHVTNIFTRVLADY